jgi:CheY-like chemotaxis protein
MAAKILVVDDEPIVVKTLRAVLEFNGYEVIVARDGEEAGRIALMNPPDLIILDVVMPNMDGYAFLIAFKELRELKADIPPIPVIVMTGREDVQAKELMGAEKIKGYLVKPFDNNELLEMVSRILAKPFA